MMSKRTPLYVYIIIIAIICFLIWGQTRDGKLLPVVKEQFSTIIPQTDIAPQQNAFIIMAGFNSLPPQQMFTNGHKAIQATIEQVEKTPFEFNSSFLAPKGQEIETLYKLPCDVNQLNQDCLTTVANQKAHIQQLLEQQQGLISNYLTLQQYTKFAHLLPSNINSSVPYAYISSISQLLTAKAILDIQSGRIKEGMQFIIDDIGFYRTMLASHERSLEDTFNFSNLLMQHYFVLDRLMHTQLNLTPYLTSLKPLLLPLSESEKSLSWSLEFERNNQLIIAASLAHLSFYTGNSAVGGCYNNSCSLNRYFSRLFYKYNDTLNTIYSAWQPMIDFADADYPLNNNFLEKLKIMQSIEQNHHTISVARLYAHYGLFFLKNYAGEKQKNMLYYSEGYSAYFVKIYLLNYSINNLNTIVNKLY